MISIIFSLLVCSLPPLQTSKDEFAFNNRSEPETIDPAMATGVPDNTLVVQLFEGLLTKTADWMKVIPGHAESYTKSKDGTFYTFKLRKGLKWSDGSPLTARDYEYSWLRAIHPHTLAQYSFWMTDNIVGALEYNKKPSVETAKNVGFKAVDDLTFTVKLNKPLSYFEHIVSESLFYPVKKETVEKNGDKWTRPEFIVTAGPFKLKEWKVQDRIILEKDENYWGASQVQLKKITAYPIDDRQTGLNMFRQGRLDWSGHNGAPNSLVPSLIKTDPLFKVFPAFTTYFYWMNTSRPPLDDQRVRQALALAMDRNNLVKEVTRGGEIPVGFMVPMNTGLYKSPSGIGSNNYRADIEKAKKLLAEAGYGPQGKKMRPLTLIYNNDENHKRVALAFQQMLKKELSVELVPTNMEWKVYLKTQSAMDFDLSRAGWQGDYPDPSAFLENLLSTSGNNHSGWKSAQFDGLFDKANRTLDPSARYKILHDAEALMLTEAPIIPVYIYTNFGFVRPEVSGFVPNPIDRPFLKYISKK